LRAGVELKLLGEMRGGHSVGLGVNGFRFIFKMPKSYEYCFSGTLC